MKRIGKGKEGRDKGMREWGERDLGSASGLTGERREKGKGICA